jgi:hypothetical protein
MKEGRHLCRRARSSFVIRLGGGSAAKLGTPQAQEMEIRNAWAKKLWRTRFECVRKGLDLKSPMQRRSNRFGVEVGMQVYQGGAR